MSEIDRQRWQAVRVLEQRGYKWRNGTWHPPADQVLDQVSLSKALNVVALILEPSIHMSYFVRERAKELRAEGDTDGALELEGYVAQFTKATGLLTVDEIVALLHVA